MAISTQGIKAGRPDYSSESIIIQPIPTVTTGVTVTSGATAPTITTGQTTASYFDIVAIATGYVGVNQTLTSSAISISNYKTKTVQGWATFGGTLTIYTAPSPGNFHPYPYYTTTITTGTTFTASFSEAFAELKVSITNTSSYTGLTFVDVALSVL